MIFYDKKLSFDVHWKLLDVHVLTDTHEFNALQLIDLVKKYIAIYEVAQGMDSMKSAIKNEFISHAVNIIKGSIVCRFYSDIIINYIDGEEVEDDNLGKLDEGESDEIVEYGERVSQYLVKYNLSIFNHSINDEWDIFETNKSVENFIEEYGADYSSYPKVYFNEYFTLRGAVKSEYDERILLDFAVGCFDQYLAFNHRGVSVPRVGHPFQSRVIHFVYSNEIFYHVIENNNQGSDESNNFNAYRWCFDTGEDDTAGYISHTGKNYQVLIYMTFADVRYFKDRKMNEEKYIKLIKDYFNLDDKTTFIFH
jgi:hypothetical protein